jgi:O-antigen ligase
LVGKDPPGAASADPGSLDRLSEPLGYANAVALVAAMGILLALALTLHWQKRELRALAAALVPLLFATLYFTYGRGAWLALGLGLLAAILLSPQRRQLTAAWLAVMPAAAAAVAAAGAIGGRFALAPVLLLCAIVAGAVGVKLPVLAERFGTREAAALSAVALVALATVVFSAGGPVTIARDAYRSFTDPAAPASAGARLLTLSGSSRVDYWRVAWNDVKDHPEIGSGAGSYRRYWLRNRTVPQPARDAHSLYLETLAELGPAGLVFLLAALGVPLAAAIIARVEPLTHAAFAPYVAYLAHASQDWDWEVPAVTVTAVVCAATLLLATRRHQVPLLGPARIATAAGAVVLAVLAIGAYAGNHQLVLAERGSEQSARRAGRWQPWSAEPLRLLGEARLAKGDVAGARRSFEEGLERDRDEWELWVDLALATVGHERSKALDRAAELNPLAPELTELRSAP